jgi:hypothetical protein
VQELQAELAIMTARSDLEVLGLDSATDRNALRFAFERLARRWHPSVTHVDGLPEVRRLTGEIFLRIHEAYRRLRDALVSIETVPSQTSSRRSVLEAPPAEARRVAAVGTEALPRQGSSPRNVGVTLEPRRPPNGESEREDGELPPPPIDELEPMGGVPQSLQADELEPMSGVPENPQTGETERIEVLRPPTGENERAADLAARSEQLASQLRRRAPEAPTTGASRGENRSLVDEALRLVAEKRYDAAIDRLERALQRAPEPRLRVLLCVVQARQALTERDFPRARTHYEAVLELDPENEVAKRELLMLSALRR